MGSNDTFELWTGDYDKVFYDVLKGTELVKHCWPNDGKLTATDGTGRVFIPEDNVKVRKSPEHPLDRKPKVRRRVGKN